MVIASYKFVNPDEELVIVHGAARGADSIADQMARELGVRTIPIPAQWKVHGKAAGPIRNQQMLDEHPDIAITYAFRLEGRSNGTDDMISRSKDAGIPTYITYRR
jgi:hypothetical protein